jgi:hypothetical protein
MASISRATGSMALISSLIKFSALSKEKRGEQRFGAGDSSMGILLF